ncbi:hypothetical protein DL771_004901 [Monosporascus sp. 5C6A]|nr:hypothetical protein DL771_004901 [Monosporascus sp. 5C6A]
MEDKHKSSRWSMPWTQLEFKYQARRLHKQALDLRKSYEQTKDKVAIEKAVQLAREADSTVPNHPDYMINLARSLEGKYLEMGQEVDLEEAIQKLRDAAVANPKKLECFQQLGRVLFFAYESLGRFSYIDEGLAATRRVVELCDDHLVLPAALFLLRTGSISRCKKVKSISHLEEAIEAMRRAMSIDKKNPVWPATLLKDLEWHYRETRLMSDLEEMIQLSRQLVCMGGNENEKAKGLFSLGNCLHDRYESMGEPQDLDEANRAIQEATQLAKAYIGTRPAGSPEQVTLLSKLASSLLEWSKRTKATADIAETIRVTRHAVELTPVTHPKRIARLMQLGRCLLNWSPDVGTVAELEEDVAMIRTVVDLAPDDCYNEGKPLFILPNCLYRFYVMTGTMEYLDEAIQILRRAVSTIPKGNPSIFLHLDRLAPMLCFRYTQTRALSDLKESVKIAKRVVDMTPLDHPQRADRLQVLASLMDPLASREKEAAGLQNAIKISREALSSTPEGHSERPYHNIQLSRKLMHSYRTNGNEEHLEEAIQRTREAIDLVLEDNSALSKSLTDLSSMLHDRYVLKDDIRDLDEAVSAARRAAVAQPNEGFGRSMSSSNLARLLLERYFQTKSQEDFAEANAILGSILDRSETSNLADAEVLYAGRLLANNEMGNENWPRAFEILNKLINLIPRWVPRALELSDKQFSLGNIFGIASDAATAAIRAKKNPFVALELLERSRGVLGTSLEEMRRFDSSAFQQAHPDLAERFQRLQGQLEEHDDLEKQFANLELQSPDDDSRGDSSNPDQRYKAGNELSKLIDEIRQLPGMEGLFGAPGQAEIQNAASQGPIVVINVSQSGCDAILVEQGQIRTLPLDRLSWKDIRIRAREESMGNPNSLEWLWDTTMDPILTALGFTEPVVGNEWPHVWWIPTGHLTKFPIHAAGYHGVRGKSVLDRVMSSYSSSVKAIINGRRRRLEVTAPGKALLIAIRNAGLPFAIKEVQMLDELCRTMQLEPSDPEHHKQEMLKHLQECTVFHFAGHGYTHASDPSKSHLRLEGGHDDSLRVSDLLNINLHKQSPFLAYLSACGTGQIKTDQLMDESIHLISGCQLAGFRHVIGTLWEVNDTICVDMARGIYEGMRDGNMSDESVCLGLHNASRSLRDRWVFEESGVIRKASVRQKREARPVESPIEDESTTEGIGKLRRKMIRAAMARDRRMSDGTLPDMTDVGHHIWGKRGQGSSRMPRTVMGESDDEDEDEVAPLWVPYVHYGV